MSAPASCELRVSRNDQDLRLVTGARAEIERRNRTIPDADTFQHEALGAGWISDGVDLAAMVAAGADGWDLEVGESGAGASAGLRLGRGGGRTGRARRRVVRRPDALACRVGPARPAGPGRRGRAWFDVLVPSVNWRQDDAAADPVAHHRHARIIWAPRWCVVVWTGRTGGEGSKYRTWGLPDRRFEGRPSDGGGAERMARILRAVVRHIEWSVDMVDLELETWENYFLAQAAGDGGLFVGPDFHRLQRHLALLGHGTALNRDAMRTLVRRIEIQPGIPADVRDLVREKCERFLSQSQAQRRAVRQSFDLVANATSGQQFRLAQERADRDGAFQAIVGILAAVFVAPGLIAAFYGANVKGLPGATRGRVSGSCCSVRSSPD